MGKTLEEEYDENPHFHLLDDAEKACDNVKWNIQELEKLRDACDQLGNTILARKLNERANKLTSANDLWYKTFYDLFRMFARKNDVK